MPAVEDTDSSPRRRLRDRKSRQGKTGKNSQSPRATAAAPKRPRPKSPPNRVNPGWVHDLAGGVGLKLLEAVAQRNGVDLNIGDVDVRNLTPAVMQADEGPQPKEIASRLAAHLGHRIPGIRKLEKRMEGQDKTSGVLSDLGVLLGQLYYRNKDEIDTIISSIISGKLQKKRTSNSTQSADHQDFGPVG